MTTKQAGRARRLKRTLNQNYFNFFIPIAPDEPRMVRLRLVPDFTRNTLDRYAI